MFMAISSTVDKVWNGVATAQKQFQHSKDRQMMCMSFVEKWSEMERFDWSDSFAVSAVNCKLRLKV